MFSIDIDLVNKQYTAFADITQLSNFPGEKEVLPSIGSVFRIESVEYGKKERFYRVHLSQGLGGCYQNIASYYYRQCEQRQTYHLEKTSALDLLGCLQLAKHDAEAVANHNLRRKKLFEISDNDLVIKCTF
ncbi:unnamed protein product [Adineta ricciae]|uniref:Uncharacterized protein n=1 Tax=Adineta ricciae TaxID=249248 RepID=A0A813N2I3_ADIRI|nr:unnamed protein product [Adineta ricciae]